MTVKYSGSAIVMMSLFLSAPIAAQNDEQPSDDFLEYLAELVDEEGEWIDPLDLEHSPDDLDSDLDDLAITDNARPAEETP